MPPDCHEKKMYGKDTDVLCRTEDRTVYRLGGTDGDVTVTAYPVFPGIEILYNDVHATMRVMELAQEPKVIEINHCLEGRIEYQFGSEFYFLAPGDMSIARRGASGGMAGFPTGHYHGITVTIDPDAAPECLSCFLQDVNVCPSAIIERFCSDSNYFTARSSPQVKHIFSELYSVPENVRKGYFKVKILELLLFLSAFPIDSEPAGRSYTRGQVLLAKKVSDYLLTNTERNFTLQELSAHFGASPSMINKSFRGVFGMSPAAFLRAQKMHGAAEQLRSTDRTVLDIAGQFGYDNASKFAKAFRDIIGVPPNAYRNGAEKDSCAPG